jgi:hypothetical protein
VKKILTVCMKEKTRTHLTSKHKPVFKTTKGTNLAGLTIPILSDRATLPQHQFSLAALQPFTRGVGQSELKLPTLSP